MAYLKVTKLNLGLDKMKNDSLGFFAASLGVSKEAIESIPEREIVMVNSDKIVGVSQPYKTGLDDGSVCHKLYFSSNDYWAVEKDDDFMKLLEAL